MNAIFNSPLFAAGIGALIAALVAFLSMRDGSRTRAQSSRDAIQSHDAYETAKLADLERRLVQLESTSVSRREFEATNTKIDELRIDIRTMTATIEARRSDREREEGDARRQQK